MIDETGYNFLPQCFSRAGMVIVNLKEYYFAAKWTREFLKNFNGLDDVSLELNNVVVLECCYFNLLQHYVLNLLKQERSKNTNINMEDFLSKIENQAVGLIRKTIQKVLELDEQELKNEI